MEKVSIIIPAYNAEKYLEQCLDSVCEQTYKNIEILIVNDGSTDSTGKIIEKYASKDSRIQFFHNENHGVSYSRNYAIEHSTGTYIAPVDSDDIIAPGYYRNISPNDRKISCGDGGHRSCKRKRLQPDRLLQGSNRSIQG
ncbi:glycosyltransferase family 2 protein [Limosilactobacillus fermentum]|uniref:glycosyltransferase family 2 protein n=1 Tax=Limosilactobacillus fermentum TaxID=1613 RepID=UPI0021825241|nr:glycosyltransferase family A protein [Limosilactobacillus fermentum]